MEKKKKKINILLNILACLFINLTLIIYIIYNKV